MSNWSHVFAVGEVLTAATMNGLAVPRGTSLPSSPVDGQPYHYVADDSAGVEWSLVYDASQGKWRYVGGSPLRAEVDTSETCSSTSYADIATVGPSVTAPLAGDYIVRHGASLYVQSGSSERMYASYAVGGTAASSADEIHERHASGAGSDASASARHRKKTLAASDAVKMQYKVDGGSAGSATYRWIEIEPIFVS